MNAKFSCLVVGGWLGLSSLPLVGFAQPKKGDLVFRTNFEEVETLGKWEGVNPAYARLAAGWESEHSLLIEIPGEEAGSVGVRHDLPVEALRGAEVRCRARIRAEGVTEPPKPWNGVKFMLKLSGPSGDEWLQERDLHGSFDWKEVEFRARAADDITSATLILGLEKVSGRAQFDEIELTILRGPRERPAQRPQGPVFTGHEEPRLRGVMIHPRITPESLELLGREWQANLIRWQLIRTGAAAKITTFEEYDHWLEEELDRIEAALPLCEEYGLRVVIDLHSPPGGKLTSGGYTGSDRALFTNKASQEKFVEVWERIARRFRGQPIIWGYDLANEPVEDKIGEDCEDWWSLATRTARAVREIDPERVIIVEPSPWGGPDSFRFFEPLPLERIVYSVHFYRPNSFTHQGVRNEVVNLSYPGKIDGRYWDKEQIRRTLAEVREWQLDYGVQIYVGEFSAIRWAPEESAYRYLKDCIELFEEYGWDWSYHAFREWHGWSVEHGPDREDRSPSSTPTQREQLLRSWLAKNDAKPKAEKERGDETSR